ncbi:MAG: CPBP family intramembrane metalloprotease [Hyphomonadaceae bacterium]|nr:CPBP family intramembrane metalloprotease [Hyphomonadaceae bacterium]
MLPNPFLNARRQLRNGWWIALFFFVLTALLFPLILMSRENGAGVPLYQQAAIVLAASLLCQALRRRPIAELVGAFNWKWPMHLLLGLAGGGLLMAVPALLLAAAGLISWRVNPDWSSALGATLLALAAAAATEELLFRGFLFQRLIDGIGAWPAQMIIAALFTLTHSDALVEIGALGALAGANIFVASILFGLAYLRTRSLALPLGLHFAANAMQGPVLGFGVSGTGAPGLLMPTMQDASAWLTGGAFGLEASAPGFVCVVALTLALWIWRPKSAEA